MTDIYSPFLGKISECKQSMRKLRKKIYKHCINKQKNKKNKDSTEEIMDIFRKRNVPDFVTETLRKRRSFDMNSIKNIVINSALTIDEIRNRVNLQESEIDHLYSEHKIRMDEEKRKQAEMRPLRTLNFNQSNIYSSTNEDDFLASLDDDISVSAMQQIVGHHQFESYDQQMKQPAFTDNYLHLNESSFGEDLGFLNF